MALALTSGGESRLDGAPGQALPHYEDMVQAAAVYLVSQDQEGALYGGDPANARADAIRLVQQQEQARWQAEDAASQQRQREIAAAGAERNRMRAVRQAGGRPMEVEEAELGAVQQYADAEIADMRNPVGRGMQGRGPTRGSAAWDAQSLHHNADDLPYESADEQSIREEYLRRFGRPPRTAAEVQFMRDLLGDEAEERMGGAGTWGEQKPFRSEAERDAYRAMTPDQMSQEQLDMMQVQGGGMGSQQGWSLVYHPDTGRLTPMQRAPAPEETSPYGFPDGSRVKTGERVEFVPQPESDEAKTVWNITSEYETNPGFSNAMTGGQRVGPGVDSMQVQPGLRNPELERDGYVPRWMEGPQGGEWVYDLAPQRRDALVRDRDNWQERQRRQRLAMRNGRTAEEAAALVGGQYEKEGRPLSFEDQLRMEGDLARAQGKRERQDLVAQRGELRGAGLSPAVGDMRNRFDDLIDRLGQEGMNDWQRAGMIAGIAPNAQTANPTPLGVDAMGMQNALRFVNNEAIAGMDPLRREAAQAQLDMQRRQQVPDIAGQQDIAEGNFQTPEARAHLDGLAERHDTTTGGFSYDDEARLAATLQRPPYNMPQPEAEALAYELAEGRRRTSGVRPEQRGRVPASPSPGPSGASPQSPPPTRRAPQGGGRSGGGAAPPAWTETRPVNPSRRGRRR